MRVRLAILVMGALGMFVFGLHGEMEQTCDGTFAHPTGDGIKGIQKDDKAQPFTCLSDVLSEKEKAKKTFVWVLHNDNPGIVLFATWDDADMPLIKNNPPTCRMVSNETLTKRKEEIKSLVLYGAKLENKYHPQTYVMADPKPNGKNDKNDGDKEEKLGASLDSRITCTYDKDPEKNVDVKFTTKVEDDEKLSTYTYTLQNNGKNGVMVHIDDLTKFWDRKNLDKVNGRVEHNWRTTSEKENKYVMLPGNTRPADPEFTKEIFRIQIVKNRELIPEEKQVKCLIYANDDTANPIGGGKITVYLPVKKD